LADENRVIKLRKLCDGVLLTTRRMCQC